MYSQWNQLYQRGIISILNVICLLFLAVAITPAKKKDKDTKRVETAIQESKSAAELIDKFMTSSDKAIPKEILDKAKAVAVFGIQKIGFLIEGISNGKGLISRRTSTGWSSPVFLNIGSASLGPQIGSSSNFVVMLFMDDKAMKLLSKKYIDLKGRGKTRAGPTDKADGDIKDADIYTYTLSKGKFAGLEYKRIIISPDNNLNQAVYGIKAQSIAMETQDRTTLKAATDINRFPQTLTCYSVQH